jgi:hypothetical protein
MRYGGKGGGDRKYELANKACALYALQLTPLAKPEQMEHSVMRTDCPKSQELGQPIG